MMLPSVAKRQLLQSKYLKRTLFTQIKKIFKDDEKVTHKNKTPVNTDVAIIGGGIVGSSVAYWLKQRMDKTCKVTVIERDPSYTTASTVLSVGGLRHQFSLPENVQMSVFASKFLRGIKHHLSTLNDDPPDVQFNHQGYLFLFPPKSVEEAQQYHQLQREHGADVQLMNKEQLQKKFPWIRLNGIELASYGFEGQGWFDPWMLLTAFIKKNLELDVSYVKGEVVGFNTSKGDEDKHDVLKSLNIRNEDGNIYELNFDSCVNCAGPWADEIAKMAGIGTGVQSIQLPVLPRKRYVYVVDCPDRLDTSTPLVVDPSGVYFRREGLGGLYICGKSPEENEEPDCDNLDVDYTFFDEKIWPALAFRVKRFKALKVKNAWAGYYDYNTFDQNVIIGRHPQHQNFIFANGMSGHGLQQSIAVGRAVMELILDGKYQTIDLSRFGFERVISGKPLKETKII